MDEGLPATILTVVVVLIMLAVGTFAFFVVYSEVGYTERQTETFSVSDPSTDEICSLTYFPSSIVSVHEYNGFDWIEIPSAGYTVDQKRVTVSNSYLEG